MNVSSVEVPDQCVTIREGDQWVQSRLKKNKIISMNLGLHMTALGTQPTSSDEI